MEQDLDIKHSKKAVSNAKKHKNSLRSKAFEIGLGVFVAALISTNAMASGKRAEIVIDADTGRVLYEDNATAKRYPASITKVMTLYLLFEAIEAGQIKLDDRIYFSRSATLQSPTKLGVRTGDSIDVETAILALTIKSANDVAYAVAERLGGSESGFARMMNKKAQEIGMLSTNFANASGLPNPKQITTAEDLAKLAIAIRRDFPRQFHWFARESFTYNGQYMTNHNHLVGKVDGVDGLKTGFTSGSGYNLAATAVRDGKHIVTVVMGGSSWRSRDARVVELIETAYNQLGVTSKFAYNYQPSQMSYNYGDNADLQALLVSENYGASSKTNLSSLAAKPLNKSAKPFVIAVKDANDESSSNQEFDEDSAENINLSGKQTTKIETGFSVKIADAVVVPVANKVDLPTASIIPTASAPIIAVPIQMVLEAPKPVAVNLELPKPAIIEPVQIAQIENNLQTPQLGNVVFEPNLNQLGLKGSVEEILLETNPEVKIAENIVPILPPVELPKEIQAPVEPIIIAQNLPLAAISEIKDETIAIPVVQLPEFTIPNSINAIEPQKIEGTILVASFAPENDLFASKPINIAKIDADLTDEISEYNRKMELEEKARLAKIEKQKRDAMLKLAEEKKAKNLLAAKLKAEEAKSAKAALLLAETKAKEARAKALESEKQRQMALLNQRGNITVQVGAFKTKNDAQGTLSRLASKFPSFAQAEITSTKTSTGTWFRARFKGLALEGAKNACAIVVKTGAVCQIVTN